MSYLIDTNVVSELVKIKPNQNVVGWIRSVPDSLVHISVLTLGEIRQGVEKIKQAQRKEMVRLWLENELPIWFADRILPINTDVADRWGRLQAESVRTLPAIDSLIAATALHYDLRLVTRNEKDFHYPGLQVLNPWTVIS